MRTWYLIAVFAVTLTISPVAGQVPNGQDASRPSPRQARPRPKESEGTPEVKRRRVDLEILMQSLPAYRVNAQEWGRVLEPLGYAPQFRQPRPGEATLIENVDSGLPEVHVVAGMASDGSLRVAGRKFTLADVAALKAFLDELAAFGAAGPRDKDPKWGLTEEQLDEVRKLLTDPVESPVVLESPVVTLDTMGLPREFSLSFSDSARLRAMAARPEHVPAALELSGFSRGTAYAIVLSQFGLGFRPQRSPSGKYILEIVEGGESDNVWPVGWKSTEVVSRLIPAYLKSIPVTGLKETPASDVISAVSDWLKIPSFSSVHRLQEAGRKPEQLKYTRADGKMPPGALLNSLGEKLGLGFDIRCDEAGKLFLWVTTQEEAKAFRDRFQHIRQK